MKKITLFLFFLISINVFCQETQFFSDTGSISFDVNEYNFNIVLVPNLQEALYLWNNPDKESNSYIISTSAVNIDETIAILIVFTAKKDRVNLTYNFNTLKANGIFSDKKYEGLVIFNGRVRKNIAQQGRDLPIIIYRDDDPIGKYQYHLDIFEGKNHLCKVILEFEVKKKS